MSQFIGSVQGSRGTVTRTGTKKSGLLVVANGWNVGANISISWDDKLKEDIVTISLTSGSNGEHYAKNIGKFTIDGQGNYVNLRKNLT